MTWVLIVGLIMLAIALPIVGRRVFFLYRLITHGQPAPDRIAGVTGRIGDAIKGQLVEVLGQRRLLKWSIPGAAHAMVFWAFLILGSVYLEAFGIMFTRNPEWAIPLIGHWDLLGFAQDLIAVLCLVGLFLFWQIRLRNDPAKLGRKSRFKGSHLGGAYLVLFMIFNVIWTMFFFRGSAAALDNLPYGNGAFVSQTIGRLFDGLSHDTLEVMEGVGLLLHIGVMLVFLIEVVHSKHLHIFLAPLNVLFKRQPIALGAVKPLMADGKPVTLEDVEEMDEETTLGIGSIEDFSWKGMLDFSSCTECGRCQSQCPAWNTEKPLSPKLMIMALRDHAMAKGDYLLADPGKREGLATAVLEEAERPLVGETEGEPWAPTGGGVIDPDVLWSCVTCGACVNQCPVDIEHVDHIVDMRRYQVLVESNFPAELNQLFRGMEGKGNPWNMSPTARMDWAQGLDFDVPVVGEDLESLESVDWLFWVGCAGAYEDRAKKTTRAVAELLNIAGVSFGVLGNGETCTGDSARRAGNEFVFQGLAQQNIEAFREFKVKKVVSTCAHCFNTLKNEYKDFGIELEVVHHTQLLNRLVREGRLTPVAEGAGAAKRSITYHDPCYIGRHNQVYEPPRELLQVLPGAEVVEMERNSERSFCCGAGGARMWMEETIGSRINVNRTTEAVGTGADQIAVGCPFCRVMLSDGLTELQDKGEAREEVEVLDVAQMLLASVKGEVATKAKAASPAATPAESAPVSRESAPESRESAPTTPPASGGSLFDVPSGEPSPEPPAQTVADTPPAAGGSLFDVPSGDPSPEPPAQTVADTPPAAGGSLFDVPSGDPSPEPPAQTVADTPPGASTSTGGSLFDLEAPAEAAPKPAESAPTTQPATEIGSGSLFDLATPEPAATVSEPADSAPVEPEPTPEPAPAATIPEGGSLFDIATPEPAAPASEPADSAPAEPEPTPEPAPAATIPQGGSLFDIATPEPAAPASEPADSAPAQPEVEAEPATEDPDTILDADADADVEPETEPAQESEEEPEQPKAAPPTASGGAHTPRTDADIHGAGSLFDL